MPRDTLIRILLYPALLLQAAWVILRAERMPEPPGPRNGRIGTGPELRLLILGDSSAAGVGCPTQAEALSGQLPPRLADTVTVDWRVEAESGATTADTLDRLAGLEGASGPFDVVVLGLGVNDVTHSVTLKAWLSRQNRLFDMLTERFGARVVYVSGLPPLGLFPALPHPLRWILGQTAIRFDQAIQRVVEERAELRFISLAFEANPSLMAYDGFHPLPVIYAEWADRLEAAIRADLLLLTGSDR